VWILLRSIFIDCLYAFLFLVYVDDIIVTSNSPAAIDGLITNLQREFAMKDLGPLSFFLGIQASRDKHGLHLHQGKYITELLVSKVWLTFVDKWAHSHHYSSHFSMWAML
jgi:hypothetical protein